MKKYYVYILCNKRNGTLYVGVTCRLHWRIYQHKHSLIKGFTAQYAVNKLVYYEKHDMISDAIKREKQIKRWRREWKFALIEERNPNWQDLYKDEIF